MALIAEAVNGLPGNEDLIAIEERALEGEAPAVDLLEFVLGHKPAGTPDRRRATGRYGDDGRAEPDG